jgi:hypothetical protein
MKDICVNFPITNEEFQELSDSFTKLCYHAAHELQRKNSRNNYTDDFDDISQELHLSMIRAGSYFKRQVYIENCLELAKKYASKDKFLSKIVANLDELWTNRTRHGANRQKFGPHQEAILERIIKKVVPKDARPNPQAPLKIDGKFARYCKAIVWNGQKNMGKKITKEKVIRAGQVSLSEYDYLGPSQAVVCSL